MAPPIASSRVNGITSVYVDFPSLLVYARRVFGSEYTRTLFEDATEEQEDYCQHKCVRKRDLQLELSRADNYVLLVRARMGH